MKEIKMSSRISMRLVSGALLLAVYTASFGQRSEGVLPQKPNIVVIVTDDQRYNTIRALGGNEINTPNLDSLVSAGTTFSNAYNMGAWHGAVCVASRIMLLSGLSLWEARGRERSLDEFVSSTGLWPQHLKKVGYETYMTGKWHLRTDVNAVFDHVANERAGMPNQTPEGYNRPTSPSDTAWTPWDTQFGGFWKGGEHWSEVLAEDATNFIRRAGKEGDPFFMYLAFNAPHDPRQAPKEFVDRYPLENITLPSNYLDEYPFKEEIGSGIDLRDEQLAPFPRTPYAIKKHIQEYYASISHLDEQIGKILRALTVSGKSEDTYIFVVSDHGLAVGHHGLMGKQNMYDHSVRVPLIISGRDIPKGEIRSQQVYLQDIMPTTLALAGADRPREIHFQSLLPIIHDKRQRSGYAEIYGAYMDSQRMVRTGRHKLIVYPLAEKLLLFDLVKDPEEARDVSGDPKYDAVMKDMKRRLLRQQVELGDTLDLEPLLRQYPVGIRRKKSGWESLFNGKDLHQWRSVSSDTLPSAGWVIGNGELSVLKGRVGGDIITRDSYSDFELELEFRLTPSANSGIKYHVNKIRSTTSKKYSFMGIEYQIIDDFNYPAVKVDPSGDISTGAVYLLYPPENKTLHPPGQWNHVRIVVKGKHAEHWLNGTKIASYQRGTTEFRERVAKTKFKDYPDYASADSGRILIQDHGDEASYRNIRIRRLK